MNPLPKTIRNKHAATVKSVPHEAALHCSVGEGSVALIRISVEPIVPGSALSSSSGSSGWGEVVGIADDVLRMN